MYLTSSTPAKPRAPRSCRTWQASLAMPPTRTKAHAYPTIYRCCAHYLANMKLPRSLNLQSAHVLVASAFPASLALPRTTAGAQAGARLLRPVLQQSHSPFAAAAWRVDPATEVGITSAAFPCIPTATAAFRPRWNAPLAASSSTAPPVAHANPPYTDPSPNPSTPPLVATARLLNTRWWWLPCFPASPTAAGCSWGCST